MPGRAASMSATVPSPATETFVVVAFTPATLPCLRAVANVVMAAFVSGLSALVTITSIVRSRP